LKDSTVFTVSVNLKSLTMIELDKHRSYITSISTILKQRYPQRLAKCYVYNAPFIFAQFYSLISTFIDKDTQAKIILVSSK
jgi:hypothetical protein